ncbi:hypothetical protein HJ01_01910 [Flavobacterium frigoris PS1]|uniref:Uncharacterized protein n=1 Tax=Flavobacterium frigoris (strain PS1) TaxID=1086011 RepID=H7FRP8_FLAFP|nr:hypothetical protein HJ01_01910 [Flavobacterium frigoris PS1]
MDFAFKNEVVMETKKKILVLGCNFAGLTISRYGVPIFVVNK